MNKPTTEIPQPDSNNPIHAPYFAHVFCMRCYNSQNNNPELQAEALKYLAFSKIEVRKFLSPNLNNQCQLCFTGKYKTGNIASEIQGEFPNHEYENL